MFFFKWKNKRQSVEKADVPKTQFPSGTAVSDVGCVRTNNEDNFLLGTHTNTDRADHCIASTSEGIGAWYFAGVFDGMGGGDIGEVAAQTAVQVFLDAAEQAKDTGSQTQIDPLLRKAYLEANNRIVDLQQQYHVFGTTGTLLCTNGQVYKIFHLGDSRAYLFRDGDLFQLTRDQTLAQMKIDVGLYQPGDPQAEAEKHQLTEYIGKDQTGTYLRPLESQWFTAQPGDGILLCSDGLYDMCSDPEITEILQATPQVAEKASALADAAIAHGGIDNVTCIYLEFPSQL